MSRSVSRLEIGTVVRYVWPDGTYREGAGFGVVAVNGQEVLRYPVDPYAPRLGRVLIGRWLMSRLEETRPDKSARPSWLLSLFAWFEVLFK